jgi:hypothetical protein
MRPPPQLAALIKMPTTRQTTLPHIEPTQRMSSVLSYMLSDRLLNLTSNPLDSRPVAVQRL